mgnify:CR=1 FL=1
MPTSGFKVTMEPRRLAVPTEAQLRSLKSRIRKSMMDWIVEYVRHRVRDQGLQKGRVPIMGYSTNPLVIPWKGTLKPIKRPRGGKNLGTRGMFFQGGYAEYRSKVGLSDAFTFYNTGDAWRDWQVLVYGDEGKAGEIGWSKPANAIAASASEEKRPDLFFVDEHELSMVHTKVIEQINTTFFGATTP